MPFAGGVYIRYAAPWDPVAQRFTTGTPLSNFAANGEQCWTFGLGSAYYTAGCEHFGVSSLRNATAVVYHWLVPDAANPGALIRFASAASIPTPIWSVSVPAGGGAPDVAAVVPAPVPAPGLQFGEAKWVKVYKTELPREVGLDELLHGNPAVPEDPALVETSLALLQTSPHKPDNGGLRSHGPMNAGSHAIVRRYEFYKFTGRYDPLSHEALCADPTCKIPAAGEVGELQGAQMAAANVNTPSVTVTRSGNGNVSGASGKISCGGVCTTTVAQGTQISLVAAPGSGNVFSGWSGDCAGKDPTCTLTVNDALTAAATFTTTYSLSIGRSGSGTVVGDPLGEFLTQINCGNLCSAKFVSGTLVTLTALPAAGLHFVSWSGACSGTSATCSTWITKDTQVQANFSK